MTSNTVKEMLGTLGSYFQSASGTSFREGQDATNLWDILTALRGPDVTPLLTEVEQLRLKKLTTARIRRIVGLFLQYAMTTTVPLTEKECTERDLLLIKAPEHFRSHYFDAVRAIKMVYGYDLEAEAAVIPLNQGTHSGGMANGVDLSRPWVNQVDWTDST